MVNSNFSNTPIANSIPSCSFFSLPVYNRSPVAHWLLAPSCFLPHLPVHWTFMCWILPLRSSFHLPFSFNFRFSSSYFSSGDHTDICWHNLLPPCIIPIPVHAILTCHFPFTAELYVTCTSSLITQFITFNILNVLPAFLQTSISVINSFFLNL